MSQVRAARAAVRPAPRRASAESVAVPALRLVDHSAPLRRRALTRAATVLASALAAVGLFGVVSLHVLLTQGQAELDGLHARADAAVARNGQLTVSVAQLEAPGRVVDWARGHLGMVPLTAVAYLPAADPATPLPPVPEGPLPTPATNPAATSGPGATPAVKTSTAQAPTTAGPNTTPSTVARRQAPPSTVAAKRP
ncbi:MAG: hypothetical protein M3011_08695 [Actinomycetota bacterium]|nr:hypothetical protein [Actinomycetota bacterium]